jgi:hypothetical protein
MPVPSIEPTSAPRRSNGRNRRSTWFGAGRSRCQSLDPEEVASRPAGDPNGAAIAVVLMALLIRLREPA